jgi:hypothetical protein
MFENFHQTVAECGLEFQVVSIHVVELEPPTAVVLVITFIQMKRSWLNVRCVIQPAGIQIIFYLGTLLIISGLMRLFSPAAPASPRQGGDPFRPVSPQAA